MQDELPKSRSTNICEDAGSASCRSGGLSVSWSNTWLSCCTTSKCPSELWPLTEAFKKVIGSRILTRTDFSEELCLAKVPWVISTSTSSCQSCSLSDNVTRWHEVFYIQIYHVENFWLLRLRPLYRFPTYRETCLFPGQVGWAKILPPQCVLGRNLSCRVFDSRLFIPWSKPPALYSLHIRQSGAHQ